MPLDLSTITGLTITPEQQTQIDALHEEGKVGLIKKNEELLSDVKKSKEAFKLAEDNRETLIREAAEKAVEDVKNDSSADKESLIRKQKELEAILIDQKASSAAREKKLTDDINSYKIDTTVKEMVGEIATQDRAARFFIESEVRRGLEFRDEQVLPIEAAYQTLADFKKSIVEDADLAAYLKGGEGSGGGATGNKSSYGNDPTAKQVAGMSGAEKLEYGRQQAKS